MAKNRGERRIRVHHQWCPLAIRLGSPVNCGLPTRLMAPVLRGDEECETTTENHRLIVLQVTDNWRLITDSRSLPPLINHTNREGGRELFVFFSLVNQRSSVVNGSVIGPSYSSSLAAAGAADRIRSREREHSSPASQPYQRIVLFIPP